ncbi:RNA-directed DNA polymerase, eukaryota [Tanacetum coccineum]
MKSFAYQLQWGDTHFWKTTGAKRKLQRQIPTSMPRIMQRYYGGSKLRNLYPSLSEECQEEESNIMQVDDLINLVQNISLIPMQDRWTWTLNSSGDFSVASVRSYIDTTMLPKGDYQTRWVNLVPIKVNTFAWKVMTNSLPTRFNISRRGIDIDSISCGNCDSGVETATHLFFACDLAKQITRSIMRWWDVPEMDYESYNDWRTWMINLENMTCCTTHISNAGTRMLVSASPTRKSCNKPRTVLCK